MQTDAEDVTVVMVVSSHSDLCDLKNSLSCCFGGIVMQLHVAPSPGRLLQYMQSVTNHE